MQVLAFQQLPDVGPDLVQVILHRVELHHGRLEHGLVQLHGVDAVILVLDFHFQTDKFGLQFTCCMYSVSENESTTTIILKYFTTNSLNCSISLFH